MKSQSRKDLQSNTNLSHLIFRFGCYCFFSGQRHFPYAACSETGVPPERSDAAVLSAFGLTRPGTHYCAESEIIASLLFVLKKPSCLRERGTQFFFCNAISFSLIDLGLIILTPFHCYQALSLALGLSTDFCAGYTQPHSILCIRVDRYGMSPRLEMWCVLTLYGLLTDKPYFEHIVQQFVKPKTNGINVNVKGPICDCNTAHYRVIYWTEDMFFLNFVGLDSMRQLNIGFTWLFWGCKKVACIGNVCEHWFKQTCVLSCDRLSIFSIYKLSFCRMQNYWYIEDNNADMGWILLPGKILPWSLKHLS